MGRTDDSFRPIAADPEPKRSRKAEKERSGKQKKKKGFRCIFY